MSVLLQISDPHFGTEQPPVVEALAALARQQRPDLLVLSGDITQRARPAQFRAARAFMDRLGVPVLAVPGNHDIPLFDLWTRLRRPYARHVAAFGVRARTRAFLARPDGGVRQHHAGLAAQAWRGVRASDRPRGPHPRGRQGRAVARGGGAPARGRDARRRCAEPAARARRRTAALGRRRRRPRHGRAHPPALRDGAARPGAADVGGAGGHGGLVAGARGRAQFGEPAALGRGFIPGLLPHRAMGLLGCRAGLCSRRGHAKSGQPGHEARGTCGAAEASDPPDGLPFTRTLCSAAGAGMSRSSGFPNLDSRKFCFFL